MQRRGGDAMTDKETDGEFTLPLDWCETPLLATVNTLQESLHLQMWLLTQAQWRHVHTLHLIWLHNERDTWVDWRDFQWLVFWPFPCLLARLPKTLLYLEIKMVYKPSTNLYDFYKLQNLSNQSSKQQLKICRRKLKKRERHDLRIQQWQKDW